ncbi:50S ribosomal protein L29 [filamentous cyanobacterium LEGE 11480]|uniref:Large ribosomal subunit protein uL29 n=1 Tax=Romeriopsis navalis LEGE 11480 TaxID=2777977 RepID=A0A928VUQ2_9CYAN|nr:50S ribosomal protein L29 [Romeriopsis navalis]MBE9032579.1 50S ribosomal protein L29 [Romeriopsis navalis LEGE 11480]
MALPQVSEAREKSDEQIAERILEVKKELFQLRFEKGTRRLETPHQFKHLKHELAQLMTVERERQLKAAASAE